MDLIKIETELKKRWLFPYGWGKKQDDLYDGLTDFIYSVPDFEGLTGRIDAAFKGRPDYEDLRNYALNRWYNFLSAQALEYIFAGSPLVKAEPDKTNRYADFEIGGIKFDLKTSVFPKGYGKKLAEARENPYELIKWLYQNQSGERRQHFRSRLFLILFSRAGEHWKLKAEIGWLKNVINEYTAGFDTRRLYHFNFEPPEVAFSDILFAVK